MKIPILFALFLVFPFLVNAQVETYIIQKAPFSKESYDEFSPVYFKNGLVFSSNQGSGFFSYSTSMDERFYNIYFVDTTTVANRAKLFSKYLKTILNDGPVSFNSRQDTIYFSRNLLVDGSLTELSSTRNKLGIFQAVRVGQKWTKIQEFRFNNEWYNVTTPCLSPDGGRLYFASDKPEGFGGFDLYYCEWKEGYWESPVNLGPTINTSGNEAYPFINPAGELFFSSDGHPGLGGRDIFFSRLTDTMWLKPVRLDPPINSQYNDFGITTDTLMSEGYFSSDRDKSLDVYHFKTVLPQIFHADIQRENQYCFSFQDTGMIETDTLSLQYRWNIGNSKPVSGAIVGYCLPGQGVYNVRLDIIDRESGKLFFTKLNYNVHIRDVEQAYINSAHSGVKGDSIEFDATNSYLPGFKIINYAWDFGDGNRAFGENHKHSFSVKGEYLVNLEVTLRSDVSGKIRKTGVSKKITILDNLPEKEFFIADNYTVTKNFPDITKSENAEIKTTFSAEKDLKQNTVFTIELLSSKNQLGTAAEVFSKLPDKYKLKEIYDEVNQRYSYTVDQHFNIMSTYPSFRELFRLGFKDVLIKMVDLQDPAKIELHNLMKAHGIFADSYFDPAGRLTANAYILLDHIFKLMNKYPDIRIEVAVHSDNTGAAPVNLSSTQRRSQLLVSTLVARGITPARLVATGYGGIKPIAPNLLEKDRILNQRIEFIMIED